MLAACALAAACSPPRSAEEQHRPSIPAPSPSSSSAPAAGSPIALASAGPSSSASTEKPVEAAPAGFVAIPERRQKGFPGVEFASVRAFAFDLRVSGRPICERPLDADGRLCSTVERPGVVLTAAQVETLLSIVGKRSTFGGGSACFLPHHGFVFYDAADVPVAQVSVCFLCDMASFLPKSPLAKAPGEGGGAVGLSEAGNEALRGLCRDVGLPKCDARRPEDFGRAPP